MSERWIAGHVPGFAADEIRYETLAFGAGADTLGIDVPALDAAQMIAVAQRVERAAREHLRTLPVSQIIALIDAAIARLLDPDDRYRRDAERLLAIVTGYDAEMIRLGLNGYLHTFRAPELHRFVAEDFANPKVLDEFQPAMKGGMVRAIGPGLLAHSWAGNVPGIPLWSLVCGLLVKAGNVGKLPSAEPVFATLFARLLAEIHPPLGECMAMVWWKGASPAIAAPLYAQAEVVLAYGSNETITQVRSLVPITTRFIPYGHKLGVALVGRAALDTARGPATARLVAHDVVRYEQQGCYSPHMVYVERGGRVSPREFAQYVAAALANLAHRYPLRTLQFEETTAIADWRRAAEVRAMSGERFELIGAERATWAIAYSDTPLAIEPGATHRTLSVVAVDTLEHAVECIAPGARFLQTVGVAVDARALHPLAQKLSAIGATRITAIGRMTQPEAGWHHDGRCNLADLVRFVEIEQSAEAMSDRLAAYAQEDLR